MAWAFDTPFKWTKQIASHFGGTRQGLAISWPGGTSHIDIYIGGAATLSGGGIINTAAKPTQLTVFGCGTNTSNWTVSGTSGVYFAMYAPTHAITFSGGSSLYGAVVANGITGSG